VCIAAVDGTATRVAGLVVCDRHRDARVAERRPNDVLTGDKYVRDTFRSIPRLECKPLLLARMALSYRWLWTTLWFNRDLNVFFAAEA
jgi:hypothetical protein